MLTLEASVFSHRYGGDESLLILVHEGQRHAKAQRTGTDARHRGERKRRKGIAKKV